MKLYQPSNGTEGMVFMAEFCDRCRRGGDRAKPCSILGRTMTYGIDDPKYPTEWRYVDELKPICTAFEDERTPRPFRHHVKPLPGQMELF